MIKSRVERLQELMLKQNLDAVLVTKAENIFYLSGFRGGSDARLIVASDKKYILTDSRYREQVALESPDWDFIEEKPPVFEGLVRISQKYLRMAVESHHITYAFYIELQQAVSAEIVPLSGLIESLRLIKDEHELLMMRETARISDVTFEVMCREIEPGITEKEAADKLACLLRKNGCERESFDTIILSGKNAALPHGHPGGSIISAGDMVLMDFGGIYNGYAGDMTRTISVAEASAEFKDYYRIVLEAQQTGLSMVKNNVACKDVDKAVREHLGKYDLDRYFSHGTGHGVGLEVHEAPRVSSGSQPRLFTNMVVTIEPGIYIPGWGGIRIEDSVIVKDDGCEVLTCSSKELLII